MGHLNLLTLELFLSDKVKYYEQLNLILKLFLRWILMMNQTISLPVHGTDVSWRSLEKDLK